MAKVIPFPRKRQLFLDRYSGQLLPYKIPGSDMPKQKLTRLHMKKLIDESSMTNLLACFADQHYDEFIEAAAKLEPELFRSWVQELLEQNPDLRRRLNIRLVK